MGSLKPCPFCGGEAHLIVMRRRKHKILGKYCPVYIQCNVCNASSTVKINEEQAAEAWNRRVGDDLMERMEDDGK